MMHQKHWGQEHIPSQEGKRILITGANSGIGLQAASVLAAKGAHLILACRNESKAREAMAHIRRQSPKAALHYLPLDLGCLASVREMAEMFHEQYDSLDCLINNAGVMWLPQSKTVDGFESQIGTNHLGHFALTGLLLPALLNNAGSRVVTVSSIAHKAGNLNFDDLFFTRRPYGKHKAYSQSKLANLVFSRELERRLNAAGCQTLSVAVHPGVASTNLAVPGYEQSGAKLLASLAKLVSPLITQSAEKGALPTLYAATEPKIEGGEYIGPNGFYEAFGYPGPAKSTGRSKNPEIARQLWELSEQLTGVTYHFSL